MEMINITGTSTITTTGGDWVYAPSFEACYDPDYPNYYYPNYYHEYREVEEVEYYKSGQVKRIKYRFRRHEYVDPFQPYYSRRYIVTCDDTGSTIMGDMI